MREPAPSFDRRTLIAGGGAVGAILLSGPLLAEASGISDTGGVARHFATDVRLPGLLFAVVARPPAIAARLVERDARQALRIKGVVAVAELAPSAGPPRQLGGIAVLARDTWSALQGRDALRLSWSRPDRVGARQRTADHFVPETAEPLMQPPSATAQVAGAACVAWACLRETSRMRDALAATLGLPADAVTLHRTRPAAGTERVSNPAYLFEAARLSCALGGAPVSLVWTCVDDIPFKAVAIGADA